MNRVIWDSKSMQYRVYNENGDMTAYHYYTAKFDKAYLEKLIKKYN